MQANYEMVVHLLDLFEGRLTLSDIMTYPIAALIEMKNAKEKEVIARSKEIQRSTKVMGKPPAPPPINLGRPNEMPSFNDPI